jgi:transmembrane sensor
LRFFLFFNSCCYQFQRLTIGQAGIKPIYEMKDKINWEYYFEKFTRNSFTKEEFDQFLKLIEEDSDSEGLLEQLRNYWINTATKGQKSSIDWEEKFSILLQEAKPETPVASLYNNKKKVLLMACAAAASLLLIFGSYFRFFHEKNPSGEVSKTTDNYKQPLNNVNAGVNKAVLTLADGSIINLASSEKGTLAIQGNIKIIKSEDGQLLYYRDRESLTSTLYNTIATPRGGTYELVLSDGTKIWLNAASSLKFPAAFKGKTREVALEGEAYFEVAKNVAMPFHVNVNHMSIEVLGTHFNINAYEDEPTISTTLLEGSVKVNKELDSKSGSQTVLLKPGERADFSKDGNFTIDRHADLKGVTAWKDDNFQFNDTPVADIMRQVSRWYDVEVQYNGPITTRKITGTINRNVSLAQLIDMLQYAGLKMKVENKKIIINNS